MAIRYKKYEFKKFWYWINERHAIYCRRQRGFAYPWTDDKTLQTYKFTNAFRQLDFVTQQWQLRYTNLCDNRKTNAEIFFYLCMFRLFNWAPTYDSLMLDFGRSGVLWNPKIAKLTLARRKRKGLQIFTGAYIVSSGGKQQDKYITIVDALDEIWRERVALSGAIVGSQSMRIATELLQKYNTVGPFVAYEIACDLRFTRLLNMPSDALWWANAGPGAMRGIHRLMTGRASRPKMMPDYVAVMRDLLERSPGHLKLHVRDCKWPFEMREIEHSLCEFDKFRRVEKKEGRPRSRYRPPKERERFARLNNGMPGEPGQRWGTYASKSATKARAASP